MGAALGLLCVAFGPTLLSIYNSDPEVIRMGLIRLNIICSTYFLCGIMDVIVGQLRGMGYGIMPMLVSLAGACGLRVLWIYTFFAADHSLATLYISYPISWTITAMVHMGCYFVVRAKLPKADLDAPNAPPAKA